MKRLIRWLHSHPFVTDAGTLVAIVVVLKNYLQSHYYVVVLSADKFALLLALVVALSIGVYLALIQTFSGSHPGVRRLRQSVQFVKIIQILTFYGVVLAVSYFAFIYNAWFSEWVVAAAIVALVRISWIYHNTIKLI